MATKSSEKLDVQEDPEHQQLEWRIESIGWVVLLLVLLAALAGLLGQGPLSWAKPSNSDRSITLEYSRVQRYQSPEVLRVFVSGDAVENNELRLFVNREFLDHVQITRVMPEPKQVIAGDESFVYVFDAQDRESTAIHFHHELNDYGKFRLSVGTEGDTADLDLVVLP